MTSPTEIRRLTFEYWSDPLCIWAYVATEHGIDTSALTRLLDDGTALALLCEDDNLRNVNRIQGSPTYVFDGGRARLYGNFNKQVLKSTVVELLSDLVGGASSC